MTSYNGLLYFAATNDTRGREMWTYDGTDTVCIDHYPGSNSLEPQNMLMYKEKLYFMGRTENNGYELFRLTAPKAVNGVTKKFVQSISVYPNPSKDIVTIDMNHQVTKVSIFNISGQEVQSLKNTKTVDISTLPSGVYTFIIETEDTVGYAKVIKE